MRKPFVSTLMDGGEHRFESHHGILGSLNRLDNLLAVAPLKRTNLIGRSRQHHWKR